MAVSYVFGNLIGRVAISYLLVWVVCLLASRMRWRDAFARSLRWYSLLAVAALAVLGMAARVSPTGGLS